MEKRKLETKDLVLAGVFAALYVAMIVLTVSVLGMAAVTYVLAPLVAGIIAGPVYMLYITKVPKMGAVMILAVLAGLVMTSTSVLVLVYVLVLGIIAEIILRSTGYSKGGIFASYVVFACDTVGPFLALFFAREKMLQACVAYRGQEFADKLDSMTPPWVLLVFLALGLLGGLIGGSIGLKLVKKHFEKAGII